VGIDSQPAAPDVETILLIVEQCGLMRKIVGSQKREKGKASVSQS